MLPEKILISIITPVYNAEKCITRCIESVQKQQYDSYEHLIIDGGSTDNTISLVEKYMAADNRIKFITEKDKGVYDAMNKGTLIAHGKWLYFLGADDFFFTNEVLRRVAMTLSNSNSEIVYGNVWYEKNKRIYDGFFGIEKLLKRNICHQAIFYRKDLFTIIGLYNLNYKLEADYEFNLHCWIKGVLSEYIDETIAFYSKGGLSNTKRDIALVNNYPDILIKYLFESGRTISSKIDILAKIFRKILLRYSFTRFWSVYLKNNHHVIKMLALAWMIISFPAYFLNSFIFTRR